MLGKSAVGSAVFITTLAFALNSTYAASPSLSINVQHGVATSDAKPSAAAAPTISPVAGEILVKFKSHVTSQVAQRTLQNTLRKSAKTIKQFTSVKGLQLVKVDPSKEFWETLTRLQNDPAVAYAEPNYELTMDYTPNDARFNELWAMNNPGGADINAEQAWDLSQGSADVVVAIIDSGIDPTHEDLINNIWRNPNEIPDNNIDDDGNGYVDDIFGVNMIDPTRPPIDAINHGTHVAGSIAAQGDNGVGVAGVSWNTKVITCQIFDLSNATLKGVVSDAIACLDYIYNLKRRGINIVASNNSWGWVGTKSKALEDAINRQAEAGILFIASAGNNSISNDVWDDYPANYQLPNVISVAATTDTDGLASFSSYGSHSVHVGAPGHRITSSVPGWEFEITNPFSNIFYDDMEGNVTQWNATPPWSTTTNQYHSITASWTDSPNGSYENDTEVSLTSPVIDLANVTEPLYLGFYASYAIETGWDKLFIEANVNGLWVTLGALTGKNNGFEFYYYAIPTGYYSSQFQFRFRLSTDSSIVNDGVYLDDIGIGTLPANITASNRYATFSGTSMAAPHVTGLAALLKSYDSQLDWKQIKNLILSSGTPTAAMQHRTISGRRIRAADTDGTGALTCNNQTVNKRLSPKTNSIEVGSSEWITLSVLHINCGDPAGNPGIVVEETNDTIVLLDNGAGVDHTAGDGIYSAQLNMNRFKQQSLSLNFPDSSTVTVNRLKNYSVSKASFDWRDIQDTATAVIMETGRITQVDLPFPIPFAETQSRFDAIGISDSGYIALSNQSRSIDRIPSISNTLLPTGLYSDFFNLHAIVAPFWDDLVVANHSHVVYAVAGTPPNREVIVEWQNVTHFEYGGDITFQLVFFENSADILMNYADIQFGDGNADYGASATIGIQTTATNATTYSINTASLGNAQTLRWTTRPPTGGGGGGVINVLLLACITTEIARRRKKRNLERT
ncbi:MAG: S8 family serine peptidase [Gammaproteobacteria bacterium]|nr:S8 family serine peptidase [Gammaproteobacteria bacterium]MDH5800416.1 S8 family serine peptidase [Gammaproteobacteria bacterium]